ncbi:MAG: helix-turn-helix transcriptional regulator [Leptospiraceae bacterium]|nr:helix-turn-helix transcriptional regulator [Leptospiraceae bacterium]
MDERVLFLFPDRSLFVGPLSDNGMHRHHALQIVSSPEPVSVMLEAEEFQAPLVILAPNVKHAVSGDHTQQCILLLDAESALCETISRQCLKGRDALTLEAFELEPIAGSEDCRRAPDWITSLIRSLPGLQVSAEMGPMDHRIVAACEYIQSDPDLKVSLIELAQHTGLSEGRFTHLFKESMGIPIRKYILWLRLRKSVESLRAGLSLTDAAHAAGFADQAHMSRSFKDHFGASPAELLTQRGGVRIHFCG